MNSHPPILALPTELLLHIFSICCWDGTTIQVGYSRHLFQQDLKVPTPVVLSNVSSQWRQLAKSFPALWSRLRFEIGGDSGESRVEEDDQKESDRCHRITEYFLRCASEAPLDLVFAEVLIDLDTQYIEFDLTLDALCRRARQWASVHFDVDHTFFQRNAAILSKIRGNLDNLHTFQFVEDPTSSPTARTIDFLVPCPSLRHADLQWSRSRPYDSGILPTLIPWRQLVRLSLFLQLDAPSVSEIVSLCPNLEHLSLGTYMTHEGNERPTSWNILSLSIEIEFTHPMHPDFWENLTTPRLTSLDLCTSRYNPRIPLSQERELSLLNFIRRSSSTITTLSIRRTIFSPEQVVRMLELLPGLTTLYVHESEQARDSLNIICQPYLFTHLLIDPDSGDLHSIPFLPRLTTFRIVVHGDDLAHEALIEALRSRWIPDPSVSDRIGIDSLRSVEVSFLDKTTNVPESLLRLKELKREGLRVLVPDVCHSL
ncbi:hypothetical protein PM082_022384 [Marasmius tenuissimus]|nr:hypothetical protein PM082_022384 [Marasmius tenuissimus]